MAHKSYSGAKNPQPKQNPFPLIVAGVALALVALGAFFLFGRGDTQSSKPVEVAGQPNLAVDRQQIDFGKVPVEQMVKAEFELSNTGDQALQILGVPQVEVREGCWPPRAVVGSTTLQPGQSTNLSMEFTMHAGMEGPHDFRVKVKTNDPDEPVKELIVLSDWG